MLPIELLPGTPIELECLQGLRLRAAVRRRCIGADDPGKEQHPHGGGVAVETGVVELGGVLAV